MRTSNDIQDHELDATVKFCSDHDIIFDASESGIANGKFLREYFLNTWKETITEENLEKALPQLRPHLKFKSKARSEYEKIANQEPDRAMQLAAWLGTQKHLVNSDSDATYENLTLLLTTLRGYEISPARIRDAEDRIANKAGRKLHYVQAPRRTEPISAAAKADKDYRPGQLFDSERANEPRWVKIARERSEREAAEAAANQQNSASAQARAAAEARTKAESIATPSAAETEQIQRIFIMNGTNVDWPETRAARERMQAQFTKAREVRRFVR